MHELETVAERVGLEECKRLEMPHDLLVRLGPGGVVERLSLRGRVREADLLRENRLAAPGWPRDDDHGPFRQATAHDEIKACVPGRELLHPSALARSWATRCVRATGSNGLRKNASAVVRRSEPGLELTRMIGIVFVAGFRRRRSITSPPFINGIMKSVATRSGIRPPSILSIAAWPFGASSTSCPASSSVTRSKNRMLDSSSMTKISATSSDPPKNGHRRRPDVWSGSRFRPGWREARRESAVVTRKIGGLAGRM